MKITIWTLATDSPNFGLSSRSFTDEASARAAFVSEVDRIWSDWEWRLDDGVGLSRPEDPQEAYNLLIEDLDDFNDYVELDSQEHELTPFNSSALSLELEAALCAWEWMLEHDTLKSWFEDIGYSAMRHCSMQAGAIALETYELMESKGIEFHSCYDWQFVPAVMKQIDWEKLVEHNQYNGPAYEPDLEALLATIMQSNSDFETPLDRWITAAKSAARKQWAYPELVDDHINAIDLDVDPATWVKELGQELDLIPYNSW